MMMVTIKEIAQKAEVSIGTVDRVLHNRGRVSPETVKRVRKIIRQLDYKPDVYARNLKLGQNFRFGIIMPEESQDGWYWKQPAAGMRKALNELQSHRVSGIFFYYDKYNPSSILKLKRKLKDADLDGLLIAPALMGSFMKLLRQLPENLPYIFIDSDLPDLEPLSIINQDAYHSGRLAAELMTKIVPESGSLLTINMIPDDYHLSARVRGFSEYFEEHKSSSVHVEVTHMATQPASIFELIARYSDAHPDDFRGVFVTNALTYRVAQAIQDLSMVPRPALIGYDLIESNAKWLERGVIDFIISQRPDMQGYHGIYSLYRHILLNEKVEERMVIPLDIISKENMVYHYPYKN